MTDFQAIQTGLATAAATISGLRTFSTLPGAINPPTFAPVELDLSYDQTFSGLTQTLFTCGLYVSAGDDPTGRVALAGYLAPTGTGSVKAALESDKTLGGVSKTLVVERVRGAYRLYNIGGTDYLGATFDVRVWA